MKVEQQWNNTQYAWRGGCLIFLNTVLIWGCNKRSTLTDYEDSSSWQCPLGAFSTNASPLLFFRSGHSGGLHRCLCPGCDDPPPLPAATGPEEQQHQGGAQTHHVHRLQDRDTPPQLSQGQHEGILHLITVNSTGLSHKLTSLSLSYKGLAGGRAAAAFLTTNMSCALEVSQEHSRSL